MLPNNIDSLHIQWSNIQELLRYSFTIHHKTLPEPQSVQLVLNGSYTRLTLYIYNSWISLLLLDITNINIHLSHEITNNTTTAPPSTYKYPADCTMIVSTPAYGVSILYFLSNKQYRRPVDVVIDNPVILSAQQMVQWLY